MTVLFWTRPAHGHRPAQPTKNHVSIDGAKTVEGFDIPPDATVVAVTPDWHEHATCYNCAYRLWPDHAPPGYVQPVNGADFPPRRECPHFPGQGRDPLSCGACTPPPAQAAPAARQAAQARGNPDPGVIRLWHVANKYDHDRCGLCGDPLTPGEEINIEFEAGTCHAACSDAPYLAEQEPAPDVSTPHAARPDLPGWPPAAGELQESRARTGEPWEPQSARGRLDDHYGRLRSRSKHAWTAVVERGDAQAAELYRDILMDLAAQVGAACDAMDRIRLAGPLPPGTEPVPGDVLDPPPEPLPEPAEAPPGGPVLTFRPYPWEEDAEPAAEGD